MSQVRLMDLNCWCVALILQWHVILWRISWIAERCIKCSRYLVSACIPFLWIWKHIERTQSWQSLFEGTLQTFTKSGSGNLRKISDRTAGVLGEIWIRLPNTRSVSSEQTLSVESTHPGKSLNTNKTLLWSVSFKAVLLMTERELFLLVWLISTSHMLK